MSASSDGDLTAKAANYTMSGMAPETISGFRGAILTKDGAETRVYTNIKPAFPKYRRYSVRREGDSAIRIMKL